VPNLIDHKNGFFLTVLIRAIIQFTSLNSIKYIYFDVLLGEDEPRALTCLNQLVWQHRVVHHLLLSVNLVRHLNLVKPLQFSACVARVAIDLTGIAIVAAKNKNQTFDNEYFDRI
jgi:hypothetical protein